MNSSSRSRIAGVLIGTAVGDALGLPAEGMSPAAIERRGWKSHWKHRLLFGSGMWSDDTEHTIMLCQALLRNSSNAESFQKAFAWELRFWLLGLPAGVGLATARSILKLWVGVPPKRSGVFSAGNGPCMRAAIVGVIFADDPKRRRDFTEAQTRLTHSDPKALVASRAVADLAALLACSEEVPDLAQQMKAIPGEGTDDDWERLVQQVDESLRSGHSLHRFLEEAGINPTRGISGYAYHTVPAVLFAGMKNSWRIEPALEELFNAGGDTDTVGAIAGALCGSMHGEEGMPMDWIEGVREWPVGIRDLRRLANALAEESPIRVRPWWSPFLLVRNLFFLLVVLFHGLSRPFYFLFKRSNRQVTTASP
ncbi:MAG: ADP-ribosylglycohydrolase family protein [Verrucomicrobiota bacterium]